MKTFYTILVIFLSGILTPASAQTFLIQPSGSAQTCAPGTVTLNVIFSPPGSWTYEWQQYQGGGCITVGSGPILAGTGNSVTLDAVSESGHYVCIGYDISTGNFIQSNFIAVRILPMFPGLLPAPLAYGFTPCGNSGTLCVPHTIENDFFNPAPPIAWYKNNVLIPGASGITYQATSNGNYHYIILNTCTNASASTSVTVGPGSSPQITASGPTTFCQGGSVQLNAATGSGFTYQWKRNSVAIIGATSSSYSANQGGTFQCLVGSASCTPGASNNISVTVNPLPVVTFNSLASSYPVTSPSVTLTGSPSGGIFSGPGISGNTFSPASAGAGGPYTITYSYTDGNGCSNSASMQTTVTNCTLFPATPGSITVSGGTVKVCPGETRTYSVPVVSGATSYTWTPPAGSSIISGQGTNSIVLQFNGGFPLGDTLRVVSNNLCGSSAQRKLSILRNVPVIPSTIVMSGGIAKVCPSEIRTYTIPVVANAISYTWIPPAGSTIISGQGTVSITLEFNSGFPLSDTLRVVSNNNCGSSAQRKLKITRNDPVLPGTITASGGAKACPGELKTYSIVSVAGATSYTWTPPVGSTISSGQGTTSINVLYNSGFTASDTIRVKSNNACGSSANRILKITRNLPATPGTISGAIYNLCNQGGVSYSITNVAGVLYSWSFNSALATVASGQGTNSITSDFAPGFISATLSVNATNGCGTSANRSLVVYAKPPTPSIINGPAEVCVNQQDVPYSIIPIPNVSNYTWIGPTGSHISDGVVTSVGTTLVTTSPSVTVDFGTTAGAVKVRANNSCASGSYKSLSVTFNCRNAELNHTAIENDLQVLPNPNDGNFVIQLTGSTDMNSVIEISDVAGKKVMVLNPNGASSIDVSEKLQSGIYFVTYRSSIETIVRKFIVN